MPPNLLVLILEEKLEASLEMSTNSKGPESISAAAPSSAERMSSGVPLRRYIVAKAILRVSEQATMHRADLFCTDLVAFGA